MVGPFSRDLGPLEYTGLDDMDAGLLAVREMFSEWDIYHVSYGYIAVPAGSEVFMAVDVDGLAAKLRRGINDQDRTD